MPTIEIETIIDTQDNIHLPERYRPLFAEPSASFVNHSSECESRGFG